jgi:N utilization substance protein A
MKNEFTLAFNEVLEEKQLPKEVILKALEMAMVSAYRRAVNASAAQHVEATVDIDTGKVSVRAEKEVVEEVVDPHTEVTLGDARRVNPAAELGDMVIVESTPADFGRVAAQTARQVIQQRIRDAERQAQIDHYEKQIGEIISGVVQAVNGAGLTIGLEMKAEGTMPRKELIPGERFRVHDRVRALLAEVKDSPRGPQIVLSRTHRNFLRRLLETEVPEIFHGVVEIRSIAREPGQRAKVAVSATQSGIDPVGACVGIRGVRIQAIVRELHDEKIDVIEWNADPAVFIAKAISPARVTGVYLNDQSVNGKTATVVVPEDQLSLAIGRDGQNARLAAKLTGWRIDIKSLPEAASDAVKNIAEDATLATIMDNALVEKISDLLVRKTEGRALSPEEYDQMGQFVDRVQRRSVHLAAEKPVDAVAARQTHPDIPASAYETNILDSGLPEHVCYILQEAGYATVSDLALQMKKMPDDILRLNGIGRKAMDEINKLMMALAEKAQADQMAAEARVEPVAVEAPPTAQPEAPVVEIEAIPPQVEPATELAVQVEAGVEPVVETAVETAVDNLVETEAESEPSLEEIFSLRPETLHPIPVEEEEDEDAKGRPGKKKSGKKKRRPVVEYDPDTGAAVYRSPHKEGDDEWDL